MTSEQSFEYCISEECVLVIRVLSKELSSIEHHLDLILKLEGQGLHEWGLTAVGTWAAQSVICKHLSYNAPS